VTGLYPAPTMPATTQRPTRKRAAPAKWSDDDIKSLLTGLLDAKDKGLTSENGFKASVWSSISARYNDPQKQANRACESKWARLKTDYRAVKFLRDLSGFGWDSTNFLVTAEDEVWEELAKVHMTSFTISLHGD
jgi:Myb/SANT-like DNA-binding domain